MTHEEKRAWIRLVVNTVAYAVYVIIIVGRANGRPLPDVPYAATLLWTIGAAMVGSMVAEMAASTGASRARDVRDKQIGRLGDFTGQWPVILGAGAAMLMAIAKWDEFWIANVIYLGLALSAVLSSATKVVVYRRSLPQW